MGQELTVALTGNPNCGKTTLFNACTGANLKVANWPGVTVERMEGTWTGPDGRRLQLVDLPGTYSLTCYTMEEQVARQYLLSGQVDVIVDVVDAAALERNLYLTLQLLELGMPVVVALNMMDIVEKRGMKLDVSILSQRLGVPVIPVCARRREGLGELMEAAGEAGDSRGGAGPERAYDPLTEFRIDAIETALRRRWPETEETRWHAVKLLEGDAEVAENYPVELPDILDRSYESEIIDQQYAFLEELVGQALIHRQEREALTDRADRILTHPVWGLPLFLGVMGLVFFLTFTVGDMMKKVLEGMLEAVTTLAAGALEALGAGELLIALITDGVIAGVGGILTFLPNLVILFVALAFLEDTGYMARVAYIMDGLMGKLGLSGRAFLPMVLGFGCTVPAIMASRVLEDGRDRKKVMLVTPFLSCSARLPIYILFSAAFFGRWAMPAAYSMYLIGVGVALLTALVLHRMEKRSGRRPNDLLIELPEYKMPDGRTVGLYVWDKVKDYLTKAGSVIFAASVLLWLLLNFGPGGYTAAMEESFAALVGRALAPVLAPAGLGFWPIAVALLAGISAKEVVVSATTVLLGAGSGTAEAVAAGLCAMGFGPLNAYCMMVFSLLYIPCAATIGVIRKESGSWGWTVLSILFQLAVAWGICTLIYQVGSLVL